MKYASKQDLLTRIHDTQLELWAVLDEIPRSRWREPGVWGDRARSRRQDCGCSATAEALIAAGRR